MPRDAAFDAALRTYAQAAMQHDAAGMRRGYIELRAVFRGAQVVPAYKQRRLERALRPRIRSVGSREHGDLIFAEGGQVIELFRMWVGPREAAAVAAAPAEGVAPPTEGGAA